MKAIEKAREASPNETYEEIIRVGCPYEKFYKTNLEAPIYCKGDYNEELCTECWNREIEDDNQNDNKLTFEQLEKSPIEGLELEYKKHFEDSLKNNEEIVTVDYDNYSDIFTYNNLPIISKYLMDVYNYCTELKNKINYVDFNFAKMHMLNGDKAMFEDETYYIKNGELYCEDLNSACALKLRAIESDKWILL